MALLPAVVRPPRPGCQVCLRQCLTRHQREIVCAKQGCLVRGLNSGRGSAEGGLAPRRPAGLGMEEASVRRLLTKADGSGLFACKAVQTKGRGQIGVFAKKRSPLPRLRSPSPSLLWTRVACLCRWHDQRVGSVHLGPQVSVTWDAKAEARCPPSPVPNPAGYATTRSWVNTWASLSRPNGSSAGARPPLAWCATRLPTSADESYAAGPWWELNSKFAFEIEEGSVVEPAQSPPDEDDGPAHGPAGLHARVTLSSW